MIISLIVALDEQQGIGRAGNLPWRLPRDLEHFKALTMGHHLIMGRKTYQSIGRPLPGRTTIIITHNPTYAPTGCLVTHSYEQALELARESGETEVFVVGGGQIYRQAISTADRIYLTQVHASFETDISFPTIDETLWKETKREFHPADERNPFDFTFRVLRRLER